MLIENSEAVFKKLDSQLASCSQDIFISEMYGEQLTIDSSYTLFDLYEKTIDFFGEGGKLEDYWRFSKHHAMFVVDKSCPEISSQKIRDSEDNLEFLLSIFCVDCCLIYLPRHYLNIVAVTCEAIRDFNQKLEVLSSENNISERPVFSLIRKEPYSLEKVIELRDKLLSKVS